MTPLAECALKPVGPLEQMSRGFVLAVRPRPAGAVAPASAPALWLTLGGEDRLLPSSVVNDEVGSASWPGRSRRKVASSAAARASG